MSPDRILRNTEHGLYCVPGGFYVDPLKPVSRAVISHAHSDHARPGSEWYLVPADGEHLFRMRLGKDAQIQLAKYEERVNLNGVQISFHPAGHILGSAQIR